MSLHPLPGYPCPNEKGGYDWIGDVDGPASYNNTGTFNTSGQQLNAADFGLGGFEIVDTPALSTDAVNEVVLVLGATIAGATNLQPEPGAGQSGVVAASVVMHWYTGLRGIGGAVEVANAVNLSTKAVRLRISGV